MRLRLVQRLLPCGYCRGVAVVGEFPHFDLSKRTINHAKMHCLPLFEEIERHREKTIIIAIIQILNTVPMSVAG